jgi:hypothetical protein
MSRRTLLMAAAAAVLGLTTAFLLCAPPARIRDPNLALAVTGGETKCDGHFQARGEVTANYANPPAGTRRGTTTVQSVRLGNVNNTQDFDASPDTLTIDSDGLRTFNIDGKLTNACLNGEFTTTINYQHESRGSGPGTKGPVAYTVLATGVEMAGAFDPAAQLTTAVDFNHTFSLQCCPGAPAGAYPIDYLITNNVAPIAPGVLNCPGAGGAVPILTTGAKQNAATSGAYRITVTSPAGSRCFVGDVVVE